LQPEALASELRPLVNFEKREPVATELHFNKLLLAASSQILFNAIAVLVPLILSTRAEVEDRCISEPSNFDFEMSQMRENQQQERRGSALRFYLAHPAGLEPAAF
jgi:hypothetical protein